MRKRTTTMHQARSNAMQLFMTALAVIAGMTFSLAIAISVEELVFGKVFGFMARHMSTQAVEAKSGSRN
jgi:hypothetical protein